MVRENARVPRRKHTSHPGRGHRSRPDSGPTWCARLRLPAGALCVWGGCGLAPGSVGETRLHRGWPTGSACAILSSMGLRIEWDISKAEKNLRKHGVSFEEAQTVFADPLAATRDDPDHSAYEERLLVLGQTTGGRLLVVSFTERGDRIRIISARPADPREKRSYERGT